METFVNQGRIVRKTDFIACAPKLGITQSYLDTMWRNLMIDVKVGFITEAYAYDIIKSMIDICKD